MPPTQPDTSAPALQKGATFSTLSAISYAAAVVFVRYAYQAGITPGTAIFLRFAIASAVLLLFLILSGRWTRLPRPQMSHRRGTFETVLQSRSDPFDRAIVKLFVIQFTL